MKPSPRYLILPFLLAASVPGLAAPAKRLTLDDLYGPGPRVELNGRLPPILGWISDTHYLESRELRENGRPTGSELVRVEADSGVAEPFLDRQKLEAALAAVPGVPPEQARALSRSSSLQMDPARTGALFTLRGDLYFYRFGSDSAVRLSTGDGPELDAAFSPDGSRVAFTRRNDLYAAPVNGSGERALTSDGSETLLNGRLDWLYSEEIYGRSRSRAFWWSPDSRRLAFLQLDETGVPQYVVTDHLSVPHAARTARYPKAGDPNPKVRLGIVPESGGSIVWADLSRHAADEPLIVNVDWTPDSRSAAFQVQDRTQTWLELSTADAVTGATRALLRETSPAWVNRLENPLWLKDGSFIWQSERTGWKHLYHYAAEGKLLRPITSGEWPVRSVHGVDPANEWVYISAAQRGPLSRDVLRVRLDGSGLTLLTRASGTHSARFSTGFSRFLDTWSDAHTPPQLRLHHSDGQEARLLAQIQLPRLAEYGLSRPEFVRVKARDGFDLEGMLLKPPDFDPTRRYPVIQMVYAGPDAPVVSNSWGGASGFDHLLAQHGVVVWRCDNRTASEKGAQSSWPLRQGKSGRLGERELQDIEDGLAWLKTNPWVDGSRVGIMGGSYGGFMTCYALTHSRSFALGIAQSSVTDWRDYDTVYTERYLGHPKDNPDGYRSSSPRFAAKDLHGKLLLIHGTMDDNVHVQNTLQLAFELQKANRPFEMMLYPQSGHGIGDPQLRRHERELVLRTILQTLRPEPVTGGATAGGAP